ncbi:hypothetical protein D187_010324 [Cystobacter fuscus DSM 2262]|uniref:Uncharacterized protein n=1 Tax=Cystobacter fuscus (strain ATCC 25194 / DSM 2262 / NBRC 100088 / M29) TaxID=1242864 RepID=S9PBC4_CYSF2|nr:hypothetical protein [Cystobacter fuscus]EPX61705.1 hypothetical protein D187_010324 [Cystobacter fuscus DSM 2262]
MDNEKKVAESAIELPKSDEKKAEKSLFRIKTVKTGIKAAMQGCTDGPGP